MARPPRPCGATGGDAISGYQNRVKGPDRGPFCVERAIARDKTRPQATILPVAKWLGGVAKYFATPPLGM